MKAKQQRSVFVASVVSVLCSSLAPAATLWQIGTSDNSTAEFAYAPANYKAYREPAFFVVGVSDPKRDWPYVQPGTIDGGWAPGTPQTYEVHFALEAAPTGDCRLVLDFDDTHSVDPPKLLVEVNAKSWEFQTPKGAGDASVFGEPAKGREHVIDIPVSASVLHAGDNRVAITTVRGSWVLWDAVRFEAPESTELAQSKVQTIVRSVRAFPGLVWHEGKKAHRIAIEIVHIGAPTEGEVRVEGRGSRDEGRGERAEGGSHVVLRPGRQTVDAFVPPVGAERQVAVEVAVGGRTVATANVELRPVRDWELHIVHQTHLDIGFTHTQEEVLKRQVEHLNTALNYIDETKDYPPDSQFLWHPEGMWAVEEFVKTQPKANVERFIAACRARRVHIDALYAQAMTGMYSEEELFELMSPAKRFDRQYGVPVISAMQSDVPGYTWGLVAALAHSGVSYLSVGPNWFASGGAGNWYKGANIVGRTHRGGRVFRWADQPFWWVSPSGKRRVLFWMTGWGYSGFHGNRRGITEDKVFSYLAHLESAGYPYDMVMWRYSIGGDNGPPDLDLAKSIKAWNAKYASPRLIMARNSDVMEEFAKRYGDEIPVMKGDYTPYWEDGSASTSKATGVNRRAAEKLAQAQILWAMLDPSLDLDDRVDVAWNKMVMYDEHTWGAHCSISRPDDPFSVRQDKYKQAYAFDADSLTEGILADVAGKGTGAIDVYNTLSWVRSGLVTIPAAASEGRDRVEDDTGKAVPSQRLASGELAFLATDVPAFGGRRYTLHPDKSLAEGAAKAAGLLLSNDRISLAIDPQTGAIRTLRSREIDCDLVDAGKTGLNDYLYILGRDADKNRARISGPVNVVVEDPGPLVATLRVESSAPGCVGPVGLVRRIRLVDGSDYVELVNTTQKLKELRPEGVYFGFPFNVTNPTARIDVPWAVVQVEKDQLPGANRNFYCVQRWVDLSNPDHGVTWATQDAPMLQFDPIRIALPFGLKYWREHIEPGAYIYSWVMNNHWECNYKAYQEGEITFRYALRPHAGDYDPVESQRFGRSVCQPLLAFSADPASARPEWLVRIEGRGARVEGRGGVGVVVTSIRPCRDGHGLMVRLFNVADEKQTVGLKWRRPVVTTWISNPMEDKKETAPAAIEMVPFEIVTLRVES